MTDQAPAALPAHNTRKAAGRRPSRKSSVTRQRILDAAASVFAELGYGDARLADIAERVGIHLSALYYYFDTKEALVVEMLAQVSLQASTALRDGLAKVPPQASHRDRITAGIRTYLALLLRQDAYGKARLRIINQVPAAMRESAVVVTREDSQVWRGLLQTAQDAGELRADLDLTLTRMILFGAMNWSIEWFGAGPRTVDDFADEVVKVVFDGMAVKK